MERRAPFRIGVTNANKAWLAARDPVLSGYLDAAELVVAETSTVWAAKRLEIPGVHPVWGVSLMADLLDMASSEGWTVYLLGAREEVLQKLCDRFPSRWPGARLVGSHHGYIGPGDLPELLGSIRELKPQLLLVAMGSPLQERVLDAYHQVGTPTVSLGVGGSFDVHAGVKKDAPSWVRGSGFEWLYRSLLSPRLFRRYLVVNPWFVWSVYREKWKKAGSQG